MITGFDTNLGTSLRDSNGKRLSVIEKLTSACYFQITNHKPCYYLLMILKEMCETTIQTIQPHSNRVRFPLLFLLNSHSLFIYMCKEGTASQSCDIFLKFIYFVNKPAKYDLKFHKLCVFVL